MVDNRQTFLWWTEATTARSIIVPTYASKAEIHKNEEGYWLNVWWSCGVIAPLTIQEYAQALEGVNHAEDSAIS